MLHFQQLIINSEFFGIIFKFLFGVALFFYLNYYDNLPLFYIFMQHVILILNVISFIITMKFFYTTTNINVYKKTISDKSLSIILFFAFELSTTIMLFALLLLNIIITPPKRILIIHLLLEIPIFINTIIKAHFVKEQYYFRN